MFEVLSVIIIFLCSYILILRNFKLSLYVLLVLSVFLHKELFSFYRWDLMPVRVFMLALLCAGLTQVYLYLSKRKGLKSLFSYLKDPFIITLFAIWLIRGVSIIFTKNLQASLLLYGFFTTIVVLGIYVYLTFKDDPNDILKYLRFYIYLVFVLVIFGFIQLLFFYKTGKVIGAMWPVPGKIPRVGSLFWDVNHYGSILAALIPVIGAFILIDRGIKKKIFNSLVFVSFLASLLLTNSRTAWMILFFAFLFFVTMVLVKKFGSRGILYIFIAIVLVSAPILKEYSDKKSEFRKQIKDAFHYRIDSFDSHLMLLTGAYQIFEKYPILGGGYGSFFEHFSKTKIAPQFFTRDTAALSNRVPAHTIWGEALSETGILGLSVLLLFSLFLFLTPLSIFFKNKDKKTALLGGIFSSVFVGWFIAGIFYSYNSEFFWIITFMYFVWSAGTIGKKYVEKVIDLFFTNHRVLLTLVIFISLILIFTNLGVNHLIPWDEAIYAKVAKNMVVNNQYIVLHWDSFISGWFEKPPLYIWLMTGFMKIIGFSSLAARIPSAIFGLLTIILVFLTGKKLFNKTSAFISSLALVTSVHFLYYSRTSMLDVTATFFITLSLYLYWNAKSKDRVIYWILSGLSTGFAVMTKGFIGFLPFLVIGLYEVYLITFDSQKIRLRLVIEYLTMFLSCLLISFPWHFTMYTMFGSAFIEKYFLYHVLDRATKAIEDKGNPFFWYLIVLKVSMRIWFVALLGAFPFSLFYALKKDKRFVFLSIWSISIFIFFSIAKSKLIWYIIPIYPVLSLMVGNYLERALDFILKKIKFLDYSKLKFMSIYILVIFSLFYLYLNKEIVYTPDLNGSQARLLMLKDKVFGIDQMVYLDRIELPTSLFYTDGPFKIIDFNAKDENKIPDVSDKEVLVLITKKGRYEDNVLGYTQLPRILKEDGDWVLWIIPPEGNIEYDTPFFSE